MGADINIKLTPYLYVDGKIKVDIPKVKRVCPNHSKLNHGNNKFCFDCGHEILNQDYFEPRLMGAMDVLYEWDEYDDDRLYENTYLEGVVIPNKRCPDHIVIDDESDAINILELTEIINKQMEWFKKEYEKEIEYLKSKFGDDCVEVCWGLVNYWS